MAYILPATHASRISAGESLPEQDRQVQECLSLIEIAILQKASEGLNKVHLLQPRFAGWDKSNLASGPLYMSAVFDALLSNGYGFFTEPSVPVHESMGPVLIPYVHTSITWGKMAVVVNKTQRDNARGVMPPPSSPDNLQRKIQEALNSELEEVSSEWLSEQLNKFQSEIPGEWVLESKQLTDDQIAIAKADFDLSIPSQKELDLGASEAYFRESPSAVPQADPMPGHPAQLVHYLRKRGFALKGFGNSVPRLLPPYTVQTGRLISDVTYSLLGAHLAGAHLAGDVKIDFNPEFVDLKRVLDEFADFGFHFTEKKASGSLTYKWPGDAWNYFEPAPMPATCAPDMPPLPREKSFPVPVSRIGKFVVALRQAGFDVASSKDMLPQDLLDLEKFEDDPETGKAYENVLECLLEAVKRGDSELRMSIDCKIGRIAQYLRPLGFSCDYTVHAHPSGSIGPHALLIIKWRAIKC